MGGTHTGREWVQVIFLAGGLRVLGTLVSAFHVNARYSQYDANALRLGNGEAGESMVPGPCHAVTSLRACQWHRVVPFDAQRSGECVPREPQWWYTISFLQT